MKVNKWEVENPKYCVQLVHGAKEHIKRYRSFAKYLNTFDISVYGHNNQGHGDRLKGAQYVFDNQEGLYKEVTQLSELILTNNPGKQLILIGHSMGSAFAKLAYDYKPELYYKLILVAITNPPLYQLKLINSLNDPRIFKPTEASFFLDFLYFGNFEILVRLKGYKKNWISTDNLVVKEYKQDSRCNLMFTNQSLKLYTNIALGVSVIQNHQHKIPILLLSGDQDPVTSFSKTTKKLHEQFRNNGYDATLRIFFDMKHELLNEKNKEKVYTEIIRFINE